ncbi:MAG: amidohydrolase family protein [Ignavibacteriales bacterium]
MIIDFHVHLSDAKNWYVPAQKISKSFAPDNGLYEVVDENGDTSPQRYLSYMDRIGVDYSVIVTSIMTVDWVEENCLQHQRLLPFYTFDPRTAFYADRIVEYAIVQKGFKGLKMYPTYLHFYPNDPFMYPIYAKAQELDIPILFHTGSSVFPGTKIKYGNPLFFDDIAVDFPDLKLVMAHSGRGFWYDEAFFLSKLHRNLYMEISGLPPRKLLQLFPDLEKNAGKVIFGSDWSASPGPESMIGEIKSLPISEEAISKILGVNAAQILKIS